MKRGLSPLISTVILVALVVVVFVITGSWFRQFSDEILRFTGKESAKQITCSSPEVFLEVDTVCYNQDEAILVLGAGKLKFENFIIALSANEHVTLETTTGLDQFKIKKFTLNTTSSDITEDSKNNLENIKFKETKQIKVVPQIINENELAVCQNLIKTKTSIGCCKGGNACGCSRDFDCADNSPNNKCDTANGLCVECLGDDNCPSDRQYCDNNECVECRGDNDCQQEEQCIDNQCVQQANCDDLTLSFGTSNMDGEIVETSITSMSHIVKYKLVLSDGSNDLFTLNDVTTSGDFKFCYGNGNDARRSENQPDTCQVQHSFISDKKITKIKAIVTQADSNYEHCNGKEFSVDIGCKVSFEQQNCIEQDCGFNRFIPTTGSSDGDIIEDTCVQQDIIIEWYCTSDRAFNQQVSCTSAGATGCLENKCINVP